MEPVAEIDPPTTQQAEQVVNNKSIGFNYPNAARSFASWSAVRYGQNAGEIRPQEPNRDRSTCQSADQTGSPRGRETTPGGASAAAEAARPRAPNFARGTNQSGVRLYNERLVLSLIRRYGNVPRAEIARQTGLSAQTIAVIMRQLEADGLVDQAESAARPRRPAVGALCPQSGRRVLARSQDRPPRQRSRPDRLPRLRAPRPPISAAAIRRPMSVLAFVNAGFAELDRDADARAGSAALPGSASPRRSSCGTGRRRSALRARSWSSGAPSTSRRTSSASVHGRSISPTTPRPPAPPN